ncbi:sigma-54-dependent transcriptional regulator [Poriferisphaera sp. WC338]|uniref:sigma-54-dependent transcriptional regulator n=1 Tax=Poriferisphaera sp. WC338 TaxID=3425129 RepID=UPI003D815009
MTEKQYTILLIDDDEQTHRLVRFMLRKQPLRIITALSFEQAQTTFESDSADVILLDWNLGNNHTGLDLIAPLHAASPAAPIIILTAHDSPDHIVSAMRTGAFDFLPKPISEARLIATVNRAIEHHQLIQTASHPNDPSFTTAHFENILGRSPQMQSVFAIIDKVASTDVSVLIAGESGTGKELIAQAIHNRSHRKHNPLVALNTAALPATLIESMLFGHEKGAFTGADRMRTGACEDAHTGTLFLDEVTEMPIELQPKILRFAQEHKFNRLGSTLVHTSDVRLISATNRHPLEEVKNNRFREDLYYRLAVIPIHVPPLRERAGDIPLIALHMLHHLNNNYHKSFAEISSAALTALNQYNWPGNVRELINTIERAIVLYDGPILELDMLPPEVLGQPPIENDIITHAEAEELHHTPIPAPPAPASSTIDTPAAPQTHPPSPNPESPTHPNEIIPIDQLERRAIEHAIHVCQGSPGKAARKLGISEATIYRKIKAYGLRGAES